MDIKITKNDTINLPIAKKYIESDVNIIVDVKPTLQEKTITPTKEAQDLLPDADYVGMSKVIVNPIPEEYIIPSGNLDITENGEYDVTDKSSVNVSVAGSGSGEDELVKQLIDGTIAEIVIPEGTTKIHYYKFYGCSHLTKVIIPNSVKTIGREAFYYCTNLTNLIIPASVTELAVYSLKCGSSSNKATIKFEGTTPPNIQSGTFQADYLQAIKVPMSAVDTYKNATNWSNYADYIVGYE